MTWQLLTRFSEGNIRPFSIFTGSVVTSPCRWTSCPRCGSQVDDGEGRSIIGYGRHNTASHARSWDREMCCTDTRWAGGTHAWSTDRRFRIRLHEGHCVFWSRWISVVNWYYLYTLVIELQKDWFSFAVSMTMTLTFWSISRSIFLLHGDHNSLNLLLEPYLALNVVRQNKLFMNAIIHFNRLLIMIHETLNRSTLMATFNLTKARKICIPYIRNFSRGFNFCWVRNLPEIAKNRHSEK